MPGTHYLDTVLKINGSDHKIEHSVMMHGKIVIGDAVCIAGPTEINGSGALVEIGDGCDIAAFVTIHCSDSSKRCIGETSGGQPVPIERLPVRLGKRVFVGQGAVILGGCDIGDGSVIGAGVVLPKRTHLAPGSVVRAPRPMKKCGCGTNCWEEL